MRTMKKFTRLGRPLLALALVAVAAMAQRPAIGPSEKSGVAAYDAAREITLRGTVVKTTAPAELRVPLGVHLIVDTSQGPVDVHLGPATTAGKLSLAPGQPVEVTGAVANFGGQKVLLARIVKTSSGIFVLRNEHGIPLGLRRVPTGPLPGRLVSGVQGGRP